MRVSIHESCVYLDCIGSLIVHIAIPAAVLDLNGPDT